MVWIKDLVMRSQRLRFWKGMYAQCSIAAGNATMKIEMHSYRVNGEDQGIKAQQLIDTVVDAGADTIPSSSQ
eukprot:1158302-Pelagomonas_calceolata.AAC.1